MWRQSSICGVTIPPNLRLAQVKVHYKILLKLLNYFFPLDYLCILSSPNNINQQPNLQNGYTFWQYLTTCENRLPIVLRATRK